MKQRKYLICLFMILSCLITSVFPDTSVRATEPAINNMIELKTTGELKYSVAFQILTLVNKEREAQGLPSLVMDQDLLDVAMQRAAECALSFSHVRPNGQLCMTASTKMWGENIAYASGPSSSAKTAMTMWMNSSGHRSNILGAYQSIGIGCFVQNGSTYWVQCFGVSDIRQAKQQIDVRKQMTIQVSSNDISLSIAPSAVSLKVGGKETFKLYASMNGNYKKIEVDAESAKWEVNPGKILFCRNGVVQALAEGNAKLTASINGLSSEVQIAVKKKGAIPSQVKVVKAKTKKRKIILSWKAVAFAEGYQIQASTDKNFKKKTSVYVNGKTQSKTLKKVQGKRLKSGKNYYIRIRVYIKVSGKKMYGKWSNKKKIKMKS